MKWWEVGKVSQLSLPEEEEVWGIGLHLKTEKAYVLQLDHIPQGAQETKRKCMRTKKKKEMKLMQGRRRKGHTFLAKVFNLPARSNKEESNWLKLGEIMIYLMRGRKMNIQEKKH